MNVAAGDRPVTEVGHQIAGRKVEVIVEDTQGKPDVALTKLRKLVESDKVQVLAGGLLASLGAGFARDHFDTTVKTAADVRRSGDLEVLAVLPERV
jgi:capsular polysaccharide biosynthesis protein